MATIGVLIETDDGRVKKSNLGIITAARQNGANRVWALVLDLCSTGCRDVLERFGVAKIVEISGVGVDIVHSPDLRAQAVADALKKLDLQGLLAVSSPQGKDIMARIAALMYEPLALDCLDVDIARRTVVKSHFSGKTLATIKLQGNYFLCGLRPNIFEPQEAPGTAEVVSHAAAVIDHGRIRLKEIKSCVSDEVDLAEADIIITGGKPIAAAENYQMLRDCAAVLGAAVGASRAAVDAGYAPYAMQVGQTGKTVSPKLYIGCGLSGSIQHFAGMKTSKIIVAINTDRDAPIFEKCDYGLVADMFEAVPLITEALKA